jgi:hypothetical protein
VSLSEHAAGGLPVELRADLLRLLVAFLELEGEVTDAGFHRALNFAVEQLPSGATTCCCR